jgi:hypothetical protein
MKALQGRFDGACKLAKVVNKCHCPRLLAPPKAELKPRKPKHRYDKLKK